MKTYLGSCHCRKIQFRFQSEEIKNGMRCDCSICVRRGTMMSDFYIPKTDFETEFKFDELSNYLWNDEVMNFYFCKTCGVSPFAGADDYGYRVNLGCIEGIDPYSLEIRINDGQSMPVTKSKE